MVSATDIFKKEMGVMLLSTGEMKKSLPIFMSLFVFVYMGMAIYQNYFSVYFNELDFSATQIGWLSTIGPVINLFMPSVFGMLADRSKYKNTVLSILLTMISITSALFFFGKSFSYLVFVMIVFWTFMGSLVPVSDSIALERAGKEGWRYAIVRLCGTSGFGLLSLIAGYLADENIMYIFVALVAVSVIALVISFFLPKVEGHQSKREKISLFRVFEDRYFLVFQFMSLVMWITMGFNNAYVGIYMTDNLSGTKAMLGYANVCAIIFEIFFLIFASRIMKKFSVPQLLFFGLFSAGLRWLLTGLTESPIALIFVFLLHGACIMPIVFTLTTYVATTVRPELQASGQAVSTIVSSGIGRMIGSLGGGYLVEWVGIKNSFFVATAFIAVSIVIFAVTLHLMRKKGIPQRTIN